LDEYWRRASTFSQDADRIIESGAPERVGSDLAHPFLKNQRVSAVSGHQAPAGALGIADEVIE